LLEKYSPVLSLDFKNNQLLGPQPINSSTIKWPQNIILLSLDQVGSSLGPDFSILDKLSPHLPADCHVYIGGGVRNRDDLVQARQRNIAGVLIASALHNKMITHEDLAEFIFE
jgi:phosphoribosylformimino-5-aminoimidazole carboxamide ribotide isomerase